MSRGKKGGVEPVPEVTLTHKVKEMRGPEKKGKNHGLKLSRISKTGEWTTKTNGTIQQRLRVEQNLL